jgi:dTDP-4-dehydrorhamnose reductase
MMGSGLEDSLIVRTVSLYGHGPKPDFVNTVLKRLEAGQSITMPTNLISNPTYVPHLAMALIECTKKKVAGILNLTGETIVSRYDWALAIAKMFKLNHEKIKATEYLQELTQRPGNASLDLARANEIGLSLFSLNAGLRELRKWRTQLNPPS